MAAPSEKKKPSSTAGYIFRPYITLPNGTTIWAKNYGLRAFKIPVADNDNASAK